MVARVGEPEERVIAGGVGHKGDSERRGRSDSDSSGPGNGKGYE